MSASATKSFEAELSDIEKRIKIYTAEIKRLSDEKQALLTKLMGIDNYAVIENVIEQKNLS